MKAVPISRSLNGKTVSGTIFTFNTLDEALEKFDEDDLINFIEEGQIAVFNAGVVRARAKANAR